MMENLTFYVIRNKEGKYFRPKGYSGYGDNWVDNINKAKVYTKLGNANRQVTFWAGNYPEFGIPDVIPLHTTMGEPLNQDDRVADALRKKEIRELEKILYPLQTKYDKAKRELDRHGSEYARIHFNDAKVKLDNVENKIKTLKLK